VSEEKTFRDWSEKYEHENNKSNSKKTIKKWKNKRNQISTKLLWDKFDKFSLESLPDLSRFFTEDAKNICHFP